MVVAAKGGFEGSSDREAGGENPVRVFDARPGKLRRRRAGLRPIRGFFVHTGCWVICGARAVPRSAEAARDP